MGAAAQDDTKVRKLAKLDDHRPLSPAELYRALNDALDEGYDLFDLSNREARFVHSLALKNNGRKKALRRLYNSLRVMTIVFAAILVLFVAFTLN